MLMTRAAKCIGWLVEEKNLEAKRKNCNHQYCPSGSADVIYHFCDLVRVKVSYFTYFVS